MPFIYAIENKINGHKYIGKTINLKARWYNHKSKLNRGVSRCRKLQNAWTKYKSNNFVFVVLAEGDFTLSELDYLEQIYIKLYGYYNILLDASKGFKNIELLNKAIYVKKPKRSKDWEKYEQVKEYWRHKKNGRNKSHTPGNRKIMKKFNISYSVATAMITKLKKEKDIIIVEGFDKEEIYKYWNFPIKTPHNKWNKRGASAIAKQFGISERTANSLIQEFKKW